MLKFVRNSKWRLSIYAGVATVLLMTLFYMVWSALSNQEPDLELWIGWTIGLLLMQMGIAYQQGRQTQRKLDQLQLMIKQVAAGNWNARLPELEQDVFSEVHRDFNRMVSVLEARLKLLQQLGEREVMEEASSIEAAVLEERRRLARDLHDTVSQQLFALHMSSSSLPKLLEVNPEHAQQVMVQLIEMSSTAQRQMRGLIAQLRPMELQGRTLNEALDRWFPDYCRQNRLQGTMEVQLKGRISEAKEHQLFLIIQEGMANVVKHAEAQSVRLSLGESDRQITLQIEDNGTGFRGDQVKSGTYGLSTMRERAQKLGGEAEIRSKPGSGTHVRVWFPKFDTDTDVAKES
ncbi:MAG: HAMP domain-containing sensor histidine kinase [Candidatus Cohnella colombiensis]|uniref:histidine kinase n=1 Tax=Candidatus Cohnella colombiensis TaxID=3121368 RepID=A0AA95EXF6_9BACL|nr:MAG: HAMP domain-containing sensor histidine kinase [Cohnella sp.]